MGRIKTGLFLALVAGVMTTLAYSQANPSISIAKGIGAGIVAFVVGAAAGPKRLGL